MEKIFFFDTEFIEGSQKTFFGFKSKPTIDFISIGIVSDINRKYYGLSNEFNIDEAWNRADKIKIGRTLHGGEPIYTNQYWLRENILKPIFDEFYKDHNVSGNDFTLNNMKKIIKLVGKPNIQIQKEIMEFLSNSQTNVEDYLKSNNVKFAGYYSAYDFIILSWLLGGVYSKTNKINTGFSYTLPAGIPFYCLDVKQMLDETVDKLTAKQFDAILDFNIYANTESLDLQYKLKYLANSDKNYPKQLNEHNSLSDALFTKNLYEYILNIKAKLNI